MILDPILDLFRGQAITIPPMDGAFRPDRRLDEAAVLAEISEPDMLVSTKDGLLVSAGNAIVSVAPTGEASVVASFTSTVTAFAVAPSGEIAAGLESGTLTIAGVEQTLPAGIRCITALAFAPDGALWLANGSADHSPSAWAEDLMRHGATGSLWKRDAAGGAFRQIAGGLAFPYGLLAEGDGMVVSESWNHRLLRIGSAGKSAIVFDDLPGYPARLSRASDGGAWLAIFAPRNRLVEFVLQEKHYRADMLAEIAPDHWIAPALSSRASFLEPLQCGGIRTMGVHKPWSPSRSYGMAVRLDAGLRPVASLHSRADGERHGTMSAVEHGGRLIVASKGGDCLLSLDLAASGRN